jgi:hypothetical protein
MKTFSLSAPIGIVAGLLMAIYGVTNGGNGPSGTASAIHQIYYTLWTLGGSQVALLGAISGHTKRPEEKKAEPPA